MVSLEEVKKVINNEIAPYKEKIENLESKVSKLENDRQFYSNKYDESLKQIQDANKKLSSTTKENQDLKSKITASKTQINNVEKAVKNTIQDLDDVKQYIRRDCIEVVGTKAKTAEECKKITTALAKDMGIALEMNDISTSHPLPTSKGKANKFIVKFSRREVKDKFYSNRQKVAGRKPSSLPTVKSVTQSDEKIFISESLTPLRKKLFGSANTARKSLRWKFIWTNNGRIYLKKNEDSPTTIIDSFDDFIKFQDKYKLK